MPYTYESERRRLNNDADGSKMLTAIERNVRSLIAEAGAVRADKAWAGVSGDTWLMLACLDLLVETGLIVDVSPPGTWQQYRVFAEPSKVGTDA